MTNEEIVSVLDNAKNLIDSVYYYYEGKNEPHVLNNLSVIDTLLIELIETHGVNHE